MLSALKSEGYAVRYKVLSTNEHGAPQHRPRLYVVAIKRPVKDFHFPETLPHCLDAHALIDFKDKGKENQRSKIAAKNISAARTDFENRGGNWDMDLVFVDIDASAKRATYRKDMPPCITRSRGGSGGPWVNLVNRRTSMDELLKFQGFNPAEIPWRHMGLTKTQVGQASGNAMSANVLERLLPIVLDAAGLLQHPVRDAWADPGYNPLL